MYIKPYKSLAEPLGTRIATILTTVSLFLSQITPSIATVTETLKFQTYDVKISPKQSLSKALNQASPIRQDGQTYHGLTIWTVYWNSQMRFDRNGDPCRITTTTAQRQQFTRYLALLRKHELNHYAFGKQAVIAVDRLVLAHPIASDCPTLERQIQSSVAQLTTTYQSRSQAYDVKTNHGQTEGLSLPN
jgi:predicted secreted Zn-dependent protease